MKVLDHGEIELIDSMGDDESIVRAARVSHAANMKTGEDPEGDARLIDYLYRSGHTSPFEHVIFTFRVKAPIFVFRQWHRHRTWSFNEVSARYTQLPEEFYVPAPEDIGVQSDTNHQSRDVAGVATDVQCRIAGTIHMAARAAFSVYREMLEEGCPRELARCVLPVSTYSEMYATIDLHNLLRFITERTDPGAQYEIRMYANQMLNMIDKKVPLTVAAWDKHRRK